MLKNYFKKLLFSLFFLSTSFIFSQTAEQIIEIKKANNTQELRNIEESSRQISIEAKEKALEMARFIYSKISTKKTAEKVNNRFIGIEFNDYQIDKPL